MYVCMYVYVCVCVCVCVCIYIHALMTCKCVGIMCGGNRDPERKKAKNKKEWCLPSHKKRFQAFRVLKFRVFGGVFLVSYRKHHLIIIKEKNFWGVFEYSIRAKNNTRQKRSSSRDTISFLLSLSLSSSSSSSSLAFLGATTTTTNKRSFYYVSFSVM